mmetsp:Transcript_20148/g.19115  ORF Transcript_20148/g.19115 Transcript_20148/m.19115 type:complete len:88 (+) Transcript_20148:87-350(+)
MARTSVDNMYFNKSLYNNFKLGSDLKFDDTTKSFTRKLLSPSRESNGILETGTSHKKSREEGKMNVKHIRDHVEQQRFDQINEIWSL